jgi:hypothetical protein
VGRESDGDLAVASFFGSRCELQGHVTSLLLAKTDPIGRSSDLSIFASLVTSIVRLASLSLAHGCLQDLLVREIIVSMCAPLPPRVNPTNDIEGQVKPLSAKTQLCDGERVEVPVFLKIGSTAT